MEEHIRVVARFRPLSERERAKGVERVALKVGDDMRSLWLGPDEGSSLYSVDSILPPTATQSQVYAQTVSELVECVLQGMNGSLLTYGPSASGKSFSLVGEPSDEERAGVIPRAAKHLFSSLGREASDGESAVSVHCSYLEIYKEVIRDLLDHTPANFKPQSRKVALRDAVDSARVKPQKGLAIRESGDRGVFVENLTQAPVQDASDVLECLQVGGENRLGVLSDADGQALRSHTIFTLTVRRKFSDGSNVHSKLSIADLAGSEKTAKATGETLAEVRLVNASISCLGNVVAALSDGKDYIPYRDSKLTRIMQESLGGNSRTVLLLTCSLALDHSKDSHEALRFAQRAQRVKTSSKTNFIETVADVRALKQDLESACELVIALGKHFGEEAHGLLDQLLGKGEGEWERARESLEDLAATKAKETDRMASEKQEQAAELAELRDTAKGLVEKARRSDEAAARAEEVVRQQQGEVARLREEVQARELQIQEVAAAVANRKEAEIAQLRQEREAREMHLREEAASIAQQREQEVARLKEEAQVREVQLREQSTGLDRQREAEVAQMRQAAHTREQQLQQEAAEALRQREAEIERLKEEAHAREKQLQWSEQTSHEQATKLEKLKEDAQAREVDRAEQRGKMQLLEQQLHEMSEALREESEQVARLKEEVQVNGALLTAEESKAAGREEKEQQLTSELAWLNGELKASQELVLLQTSDMEQLQAAVDKWTSEVESLNSQKCQLLDKLSRLRKEVISSEEVLRNVSKVGSQCLKAELAEEEFRLSPLRDELRYKHKEIESLHQLMRRFQALHGLKHENQSMQRTSMEYFQDQLMALEGLEISKAVEAQTSNKLLNQLTDLDCSIDSMTKSLQTITDIAKKEDAEAVEFSKFKAMLQELQQAVHAAQDQAEDAPSIKSSSAFNRAGAMLRSWIEQFANHSRNEM